MKKTIKKRAFVSAIAMLIVSAIVLTSSTFAWFSMSKSATVEEMNLTVSSPEGIQISANASAWTGSLTNDDFFNKESTSRYKAYDGNVNLMPLNLIPVSSTFMSFNGSGFANFYKAVLNDSGYATVTAVNQAVGKDDEAGIVAFDIFFKVAEATKVYFGQSKFTDESQSDILTALRVAFAPMGSTTSTDPAAAIALRSVGRNTSIMFEPDAINRSTDALASGSSTGKLTTRQLTGTGASGNVNSNFVLNNNYCEPPECTVVGNNDSASAKSFNLAAGVTRMRIYIWVEGQDVDCRNSVAGAVLTAAFKFTID